MSVPARAEFEQWIGAYERAWRTAGTGSLEALFEADASYRMSPYEPPVRGLAAIGALWERERAGADEGFEMDHDVIAVDGDTGVARLAVAYDDGNEYRDLWVVRFGPEGRCREFEEWPYWPGQPLAPPTGPAGDTAAG